MENKNIIKNSLKEYVQYPTWYNMNLLVNNFDLLNRNQKNKFIQAIHEGYPLHNHYYEAIKRLEDKLSVGHIKFISYWLISRGDALKLIRLLGDRLTKTQKNRALKVAFTCEEPYDLFLFQTPLGLTEEQITSVFNNIIKDGCNGANLMGQHTHLLTDTMFSQCYEAVINQKCARQLIHHLEYGNNKILRNKITPAQILELEEVDRLAREEEAVRIKNCMQY